LECERWKIKDAYDYTKVVVSQMQILDRRSGEAEEPADTGVADETGAYE
jgi:hypothetical protein